MTFNDLLEMCKKADFKPYPNINRASHRHKKQEGDTQTILHFCRRNQIYSRRGKKVYQNSAGLVDNPEMYKMLCDIAQQHFPDFNYNWIQINKNTKTIRHKDIGNKGLSWTYVVGDYTEGGRLGIENEEGGTEYIDIKEKPTEFDGKSIWHWTEDWSGGDRYCVIYYFNKLQGKIPPKSEKAIERLEPESNTDFLSINEIFRYDIYKAEKLVEEGETWLDVGGMIGAFTLKCLDRGAKEVVTFEPNKRNYDKLVKSFGGDDRVTLHNKAVSTYNGVAQLYVEKNGNWRHTIFRKIRGRESEEVEVVDILDLPKFDGIKLDCEGSEVDIVYRLKEFPKKLVLEYDGDHHHKTSDYNDFVDFLKTKYEEVKHPTIKVDSLKKFFPNGLTVLCSGLKQ